MTKFGGSKIALSLLLCAASAIVAPAQVTFSTLVNFDGTDGTAPLYGSIIQATDGNYYGTTEAGGANSTCTSFLSLTGCGTVFKITAAGTLTTLYSFCSLANCTDGANPYSGLIQATDGDLYGTTSTLGGHGAGTIFRISAAGALTTFYSFCSLAGCADGESPYAQLVQATDGSFYGTTYGGGANSYGTIFRITPEGSLTTLHSFDNTDGAKPYAGLVQATDGSFYGTTFAGGIKGYGTIFRITPAGEFTTLYSFCTQGPPCTDGSSPSGGLVQGATDESLYGTTCSGGADEDGGTIFRITLAGKLTQMDSFDGEIGEGTIPTATLVQGSDGNIYGTTFFGGLDASGTVFQISHPLLQTLHQFSIIDGENPDGGMLQATNGNFYGTTYGGGDTGHGTVFSLSVGLGQFVKTTPIFGETGASVIILGTDLTDSTSVTFNGTPATFTIVSRSEISTAVPVGATTGTVQVGTPAGTLSSNVFFRVRP